MNNQSNTPQQNQPQGPEHQSQSPTAGSGSPTYPAQPPAFDTSNHRSHKKKRRVSLPIWSFVLILVGALAIGVVIGSLPCLAAYGNLNARYAQLISKYKKVEKDDKNWQKLGDAFNSDDSDDSDDDSDSDSSDDDTPNKENLNKLVGDTTTSGSLSMKLDKVDYPQSIRTNGEDDTPSVLTPKQGNKFLTVSTEIKNDSKQPIDLTCSLPLDIHAVNDKNQQYSAIDNLFTIPGNPECNAELQPGMSEPMEYVFEMPSNTNIVGILWQDETDSDNEGPYASFVFDKKWTLEPGDDDD